MTSFADRARAGIERLTAADRDEWLAFQARNHGPLSRQADAAWADWQALNPELEGDQPLAWISRRGGAIVGNQGSSPFRLKEGNRIVPAAWAIDLMVEPEWRLRGVAHGLSRTLVESGRLGAAISISDAAYRAALHAGWQDMGEIPWYVHPCDVEWLRHEAGLTGMKDLAVRGALPPALAAARAGSRLLALMTGARLEHVPQFDERADRVWAGAARSYQVIAVRDYRALAWRFDAVPGADAFERHYLMVGQRARGYVVTRPDEWRGRPTVEIVDYLAPPRWVALMLGHVVRRARAGGAAAVTCNSRSRACDPALRAAGFVPGTAADVAGPASFRTAVPTRFMVYKGDGGDRPALDPDQWFATSADADVAWQSARP